MDMIVKEPNQVLHKMSSNVEDFNEAKTIAQQLTSEIKEVDKPWRFWLGLAAPQIGVNKRIVLLKEAFHKYKILINPEIVLSKLQLPIVSRCLSLKGLYLIVYPLWVKVRYQDFNQRIHEKTIFGPRAAVLQQEIDHINGILLKDKGRKIL